MMKTMYRFGAVAVLAAAVIFWAFWPVGFSTTTGFAITHSIDPITNVVSFSVSGLPVLKPATAKYKIFINTGDGGFIEENVTVSSSTTPVNLISKYKYKNSTSYNISAEATAAYDDKTDPDKKPKYAVASTTVNPTLGSTSGGMGAIAGFALLSSSRNVVADHPLTYIISYQNPAGGDGCSDSLSGEITLKFDNSKLIYSGNSPYFGETIDNTLPDPNTNGKVCFKYNKLTAGERRNLFVHFVANRSITVGSTLSPAPELILTYKSNNPQSSGTACGGGTANAIDEATLTVADSHDPNRKEADLSCIKPGDNYIIYTVYFQNEGYGAAKTVKILDALDHPLYDRSAPIQLLSTSHTGRSNVIIQNDPIGDEYSVSFSGTGFNLRGLKEPGLGYNFQEEDTQGWIKFKVKLDASKIPYRCQPLANFARIIFDCNPPVNTKTLITPVYCSGSGASCPDCIKNNVEWVYKDLPVALPMETSAFEELIKPDALALTSEAYTLVNGGKTNPAFGISTRYPPSTYQLVGYKQEPCKVKIIQYNIVRTNCNLKLNIQKKNPTSLTGPGQFGEITATVNATTGRFLWSDCVERDYSTVYVRPNLPPGKYLVGVTDMATQCTAEAWVTIDPYSPPKGGGGISWYYWLGAALALVALGLLARKFLSEKKK